MSVIVRGMDYPESCTSCRLRSGSFGTFCSVLREYIDDTRGLPKDKRMDNCPLAPVVTPHGRLIDGDELAAGCDAPHYCRWLSEIEDMPTILEAEA